jgi:signal transduction histidine kinase
MTKSNPDLHVVTEQLTRLIEVSVRLNSTLNMDELGQLIISTAAEILDCASVSILLYDEKSKKLVFVAATGSNPQRLAEIPVPLDKSLAGMVFQQNKIMILSDVKNDPRYFPLVSQHISSAVENLLGVPMRIKDCPTGVLEAVNKRGHPFDESDAYLLSVIASQAAVAMHNASLVKALQDACDELHAADQLKTNFLALASHELRAPLGIIIGYATFLQEEALGEMSAHAHQVVNAAMQMRSLVDAMTNLNMVRSNEMILHTLIFSVQQALTTACAEIKSLADAKNQTLDFQIPIDPLQVSGDPQKLTTAFISLLNNAVRFTPEGGRIVIGARLQGDQVLCWVEDNGIGLASGELKKIFQEFYQVEPHTARKQGGMGIGLTIAKGLIEAHGGKIWAESAGPGQGATFKVTLPAVGG